MSKVLKLHLGCGHSHREGWVNCDSADLPGVDRVFDLESPPYPFEDNSVDMIEAIHVFEHIRGDLAMMEELHRIAKPGAALTLLVPYGSSDTTFEDPTHVKVLFLNTWGYYGQPFYHRTDYGYRGDWKLTRLQLIVGKDLEFLPEKERIRRVMQLRNIVHNMHVTMLAVKPIRKPENPAQDNTRIEWGYA